MQASQWTPEIIAICAIAAVASLIIGYLVAAMRQGRQITQLQTQLDQVLQALEKALSDQSTAQIQLKSAESLNHQQQVAESRLHEQLKTANANAERLSSELSASKGEYEAVQQKLEQANQKFHTAENQLGTAQAEIRAGEDKLHELQGRFAVSEETLKNAQADVNRLKDDLFIEGKKTKGLEISEKEAREQLAEAKETLTERAQAFVDLQERFNSLSSDHTELSTTLEKREEHFQEQMAQLSDTKKSLTQEFENLANKIFEEKGKTFTQTSQTSIDGMLKPFRDQIEGFQKRINEVHDASLQGNTSLNGEIRKVLDIGLQMSKEANNLTSALKGDSQQRGAWGEAQLRRTLEMSGLIEETHFEVQSAFKDAEGKSKQTDYLIKIPDGKHIIIDSKVSLNAYDRAVSAESPEAYQLAMAEHVKAVRKHIDDLSSKDYTNLVGMRSPSFVLMFMPIEPAYIEAMKHNKDLFEYGYKKGIVLVSHTTLIPILRTVSNLWMIERSNAEAREISEKAGEIYNQVCTVAERLSKLGGTLNTASNHYNSTVTALAGQQGLYGKIDRFSQLSAKVSKTLPAMEPAHMDFESERLSLIVVPIDESPDQSEALPQLALQSSEEELAGQL